MKFQESLNTYLLENYSDIRHIYNWPFSTKNFPLEYSNDSKNSYQNSLDLRKLIHNEIKNNSEVSGALQAWYVRDWGGVRTNKQVTLDKYIGMSSENLVDRGEKGIASWSKMLSVRDPKKYVIYDARVAMSLNTISLMKSEGSTLFFPQLSSRNKNIRNAQALVDMKAMSEHLAVSHYFYREYLKLLNEAVNQCGNKFDIQTAEMVLFANAENLASYWKS
jgi:hypothetical protein